MIRVPIDTERPRQTNYHALQTLLEQYTPERSGFVSAAQLKMIKKELEIENRDVMSLRNLRDFVVLYCSMLSLNREDKLLNMDRISAITAVIDSQIVKLGGKV